MSWDGYTPEWSSDSDVERLIRDEPLPVAVDPALDVYVVMPNEEMWERFPESSYDEEGLCTGELGDCMHFIYEWNLIGRVHIDRL
jgi:hypothetical protein